MTERISLVLCCHNSAPRLPHTPAHLAALQIPRGLECELVVVDNTSYDDTQQTARTAWPTPPRLRLHLRADRRALLAAQQAPLEGDDRALAIERQISRLGELLRARGAFDRRFAEIREAFWRRPQPGSDPC